MLSRGDSGLLPDATPRFRTRGTKKQVDPKGFTLMTLPYLQELAKEQKGYVTPQLNDNLYLHFKGFAAISDAICQYEGLKSLWLEGNALSELDHLDALPNLRCLYLQENCFENISGIARLQHLHILNFSNNLLTALPAELASLPNLSSLHVANNKLGPHAAAIAVLRDCPALSVVDLHHNNLTDPECLTDVVWHMPHLAVLTMQHNPVLQAVVQYRRNAIVHVRSLTYLDDRPVSDNERKATDAWAAGGVDAERAEQSRQRDSERAEMKRNFDALAALQAENRARRRRASSNAAEGGGTEGEEEEGEPSMTFAPHLQRFHDDMVRRGLDGVPLHASEGGEYGDPEKLEGGGDSDEVDDGSSSPPPLIMDNDNDSENRDPDAVPLAGTLRRATSPVISTVPVRATGTRAMDVAGERLVAESTADSVLSPPSIPMRAAAAAAAASLSSANVPSAPPAAIIEEVLLGSPCDGDDEDPFVPLVDILDRHETGPKFEELVSDNDDDDMMVQQAASAPSPLHIFKEASDDEQEAVAAPPPRKSALIEEITTAAPAVVRSFVDPIPDSDEEARMADDEAEADDPYQIRAFRRRQDRRRSASLVAEVADEIRDDEVEEPELTTAAPLQADGNGMALESVPLQTDDLFASPPSPLAENDLTDGFVPLLGDLGELLDEDDDDQEDEAEQDKESMDGIMPLLLDELMMSDVDSEMGSVLPLLLDDAVDGDMAGEADNDLDVVPLLFGLDSDAGDDEVRDLNSDDQAASLQLLEPNQLQVPASAAMFVSRIGGGAPAILTTGLLAPHSTPNPDFLGSEDDQDDDEDDCAPVVPLHRMLTRAMMDSHVMDSHILDLDDDDMRAQSPNMDLDLDGETAASTTMDSEVTRVDDDDDNDSLGSAGSTSSPIAAPSRMVLSPLSIPSYSGGSIGSPLSLGSNMATSPQSATLSSSSSSSAMSSSSVLPLRRGSSSLRVEVAAGSGDSKPAPLSSSIDTGYPLLDAALAAISLTSSSAMSSPTSSLASSSSRTNSTTTGTTRNRKGLKLLPAMNTPSSDLLASPTGYQRPQSPITPTQANLPSAPPSTPVHMDNYDNLAPSVPAAGMVMPLTPVSATYAAGTRAPHSTPAGPSVASARALAVSTPTRRRTDDYAQPMVPPTTPMSTTYAAGIRAPASTPARDALATTYAAGIRAPVSTPVRDAPSAPRPMLATLPAASALHDIPPLTPIAAVPQHRHLGQRQQKLERVITNMVMTVPSTTTSTTTTTMSGTMSDEDDEEELSSGMLTMGASLDISFGFGMDGDDEDDDDHQQADEEVVATSAAAAAVPPPPRTDTKGSSLDRIYVPRHSDARDDSDDDDQVEEEQVQVMDITNASAGVDYTKGGAIARKAGWTE
ncbi:hypothetical protein BC828DRAFT_193087 [Blastocladiella britannica]|nr:hypothetical protein BC828DRAFT_193087 [Blastocladiella britannica]